MRKISAALLVLLPAVCYSASFDCNKAKSKVEKAICGDSELSKLDEDMATAYKFALKTHPVSGYVKARQKDWLSLNGYCDRKKFNECLKANYKTRIASLQINNSTLVYASNKEFSYSNGDMVVEVTTDTGKVSVWGGFAMHNQASQAEGKPVYTGCEFEGVLKDKTLTSAIDSNGTQILFAIKNNHFEFDPNAQEKICAGFASIPAEIKKVN